MSSSSDDLTKSLTELDVIDDFEDEFSSISIEKVPVQTSRWAKYFTATFVVLITMFLVGSFITLLVILFTDKGSSCDLPAVTQMVDSLQSHQVEAHLAFLSSDLLMVRRQ